MSSEKKILALRLFTGCLFVFSGIVKLFPIIAFEVQLISQGIINWTVVVFLARGIIAFEIFLGLSFFQNKYLKKFFIPAAFLLLAAFTLELIRTIFFRGFSGDCGCFGQILVMTPLQAIVKNVILMAGLAYLYTLMEHDGSGKPVLPAIFFVVPFAVVFAFFPFKKYQIETKDENRAAKRMDTAKAAQVQNVVKPQAPVKKKPSPETEALKNNTSNLPVAAFKEFSGGVTADFTKGVEIVAVLNTECEDCIDAATAIGKLNREMKMPPVYFLLLGTSDQLPDFIKKTNTNFPYKLLDDEAFFMLIKGSPPRIWLLRNGNIIGDWNYKTFSADNLKSAVLKIQK